MGIGSLFQKNDNWEMKEERLLRTYGEVKR